MDGLRREGGGVGGTDKRFARCLFGRRMGGVGWLGAGSLHGAAPSRGWLPRGGGSLERAYNQTKLLALEEKRRMIPKNLHPFGF